jgi:uncharacterized membrane-anchored protein
MACNESPSRKSVGEQSNGLEEGQLAMLMNEMNVLLRGGPNLVADKERVRYVKDVTSKLKLACGNRYEHFEPTTEMVRQNGQTLQVFVWTGCTYMAE